MLSVIHSSKTCVQRMYLLFCYTEFLKNRYSSPNLITLINLCCFIMDILKIDFKKKNDCGSRNAVTTYSTGWCHFLDPGHQLYPPSHLPVTVHVETVGKSLNNLLVLIWKNVLEASLKRSEDYERFTEDFEKSVL